MKTWKICKDTIQIYRLMIRGFAERGGQESTVLGFQDGPWEYGTICRAYLTIHSWWEEFLSHQKLTHPNHANIRLLVPRLTRSVKPMIFFGGKHIFYFAKFNLSGDTEAYPALSKVLTLPKRSNLHEKEPPFILCSDVTCSSYFLGVANLKLWNW